MKELTIQETINANVQCAGIKIHALIFPSHPFIQLLCHEREHFEHWNSLLGFSTIGDFFRGYSIYLYNLGKLAKRGGGGYPQALLKVITFGEC